MKREQETVASPVADARTQEQIEDDQRYRAAELRRQAAMHVAVPVPATSIDDEPAIVRGTD